MSGWDALARTRTTPWSVWKFNWLANHKIIAAVKRASRHAHGQLLDVGCGAKPFAGAFEGKVSAYMGVDLRSSRYLGASRPEAFARAEALPFRDGSFDTVLGLSMTTYFEEPLLPILEAHRVLRPGGTLLLEFTQMAPLHDEPYDFFRFTRYGAASLLERAGFEPLEFIPIGGIWARVGLSMIAGLNRMNRGPLRILTELPVRVLYVVLQLLFDLLDRLFSDPREPLSHLVVARRREGTTTGRR